MPGRYSIIGASSPRRELCGNSRGDASKLRKRQSSNRTSRELTRIGNGMAFRQGSISLSTSERRDRSDKHARVSPYGGNSGALQGKPSCVGNVREARRKNQPSGGVKRVCRSRRRR